jgi:hypothetical protein
MYVLKYLHDGSLNSDVLIQFGQLLHLKLFTYSMQTNRLCMLPLLDTISQSRKAGIPAGRDFASQVEAD